MCKSDNVNSVSEKRLSHGVDSKLADSKLADSKLADSNSLTQISERPFLAN